MQPGQSINGVGMKCGNGLIEDDFMQVFRTGDDHLYTFSVLYEYTLGSLTFGTHLFPLKAISLHVQETGGL